jgi:hypothetical protein
VVGLAQTFTLANASVCTVKWHDNAAIGVVGTPYTIAITGSLPLSVGWSAPHGAATWRENWWSFGLEPGTYTLEFRPTSLGVNLLDNVSFHVVAVPEPGTWAAFAALGCLGWAVGRLRWTRHERRQGGEANPTRTP